MSEDKPKVIVIKKPQAPVKETPQVKEAPNKEEKKVSSLVDEASYILSLLGIDR